MDPAGAYMTAWSSQQQHPALTSRSPLPMSMHHLPSPADAAIGSHRISSGSSLAGVDVYCQQSEYAKEEPLSIYEPEAEDGDREDSQQGRDGARSHSTPMTLKWLSDNYEIADGVCIPRSALYQHYLDFSEKADIIPVNAASFGKIIRQQFPQITTRRLGTRGQSKYHYYGIGVKETSPYYDYMYSKAGQQQQSMHNANGKKEVCKQVPLPYSPRSRIGTLLPDFPSISELKLPEDVPTEKVLTFVMMYRTHCQRILDTVIRANFDEVQSFLLHFWQGMPPHMVSILGLPPIVSLVAACDCILYRSIASVLSPNVLQALPESLTQIIRKFAKQLRGWIHAALLNLPESLRSMKFKVARQFAKILTLQVSLNHLCQASRTVMQSGDVLVQMLEDWRSVDKGSISKQTLYMLGSDVQPLHIDKELDRMLEFYNEFEALLQGQCQIEAYIQWLDRMIDACVVRPGLEQPSSKRKISRNFLLVWSCFGTRIIRDMTLHSSPSFGSFHLLHLMFDDYILYHMELLHCQDMTEGLIRQIRGETIADMPELRDDLSSELSGYAAYTSVEGSNGSGSSSSHSSSSQVVQLYGAQQQQQQMTGAQQDRYGADTIDSPVDQKPVCLQRHASTVGSAASERYDTPPNGSSGVAYATDAVQSARLEQFYRCPPSSQSQHQAQHQSHHQQHHPTQHQPQHQLPPQLQHHHLHSDLAHNWRAAAATAAAASVGAAPVIAPPPGPGLLQYHPCYQTPPMMSMAPSFLPYAALGNSHFSLDPAAGCSYPPSYGGIAGDFAQAKGSKRSVTAAATSGSAAPSAAAPERGGISSSCAGMPTSMDLHHHHHVFGGGGGGKRFHHHHPGPEGSGAPGPFSFIDSSSGAQQAAYAMT